MNDDQLEKILFKYTDDVSYWPPEILPYKYNYIDSEKEDVVSISILHLNGQAFKARIMGTIVDDWLTKERFAPIAQNCITVLQQCDNLENWQLQLIDLFKSYA